MFFSFQPVSISKASGGPATASSFLSSAPSSRPLISPLQALQRHGASTGRKAAESVSPPATAQTAAALHAAEGALDCSCHLVSSFGSRLGSGLTRHALRQPGQLCQPPASAAPPASPRHPLQGEGWADTTGEGTSRGAALRTTSKILREFSGHGGLRGGTSTTDNAATESQTLFLSLPPGICCLCHSC